MSDHTMNLTLKIWRQAGPTAKGALKTYELKGVSEHQSFLEMIDQLNDELVRKGEEQVAFESDCREGICGACGCMVNGQAHGPDKGITLCGCETPWNQTPWTAPDAGDDPLFVLTHTADNIYRLAKAGATAAFAGHYHGGQILLPGFGPIVLPSAFGRRFPHGHYVIEKTHLLISAGVGVARPTFRLYCPPDILVIDVKPEAKQREKTA